MALDPDVARLQPELACYRHAFGVAHAAANHRHKLEQALAVGVDLIEADLWPRGSQVVARHEHGIFGLPLIYDKWYAWPEFRPTTLGEIAQRVAGRCGLYLDLKSDSRRFLADVVQLVRSFGLAEQTAVSSHHWRALQEIEALEPALHPFYTVTARRHVEPFWDHIDEHPEVSGVAIRHGLLDANLVAALKGRGLTVFAWTVDNPARALQLLRWGVDGIISNKLALLSLLRNGKWPPPGRCPERRPGGPPATPARGGR